MEKKSDSSLDDETEGLFRFLNIGTTPGEFSPWVIKKRPKWIPKYFKELKEHPITLHFLSEADISMLVREDPLYPSAVNLKYQIEKKIESQFPRIKDLLYFLQWCILNYIENHETPLWATLRHLKGFPKLNFKLVNGQPHFVPEYWNLYERIAAYYTNFVLHHKDLHDRIKVCQMCGRFFICWTQRQLQRKQYCDLRCRRLANRKSRDKHAEQKKVSWKKGRDKKEYERACNYIDGLSLTREDATGYKKDARHAIRYKNMTCVQWIRQEGI